jgi:hypothetical protein
MQHVPGRGLQLNDQGSVVYHPNAHVLPAPPLPGQEAVVDLVHQRIAQNGVIQRDRIGAHLERTPVPIGSWMKARPTLPVQHDVIQCDAPGTPGSVPTWKNRPNLYRTKNTMLGTCNTFDLTSRFRNKPFVMVDADRGYSPTLLQPFHDEIAVDDKGLLVAENATHFDLCDKPEYTDPMVDRRAGSLRGTRSKIGGRGQGLDPLPGNLERLRNAGSPAADPEPSTYPQTLNA